MATMVDSLLEQLTKSGAVDRVAGRLGVEPARANAAVASAIPAIMAGLAKNSQSKEGAASLSSALDKDHDGSVLDDDGYFDRYEERKGDRILGHVFGEKKGTVESQVAQLGGLSGGQGADLMKMLAPLVMGYLGKQKSAGGFDVGDLAGILGGGGDLSKMLPGGLGDLLGGLAGGAASSSATSTSRAAKPKQGSLGSILGGFFKKKR